jgi:hypothetical protein
MKRDLSLSDNRKRGIRFFSAGSLLLWAAAAFAGCSEDPEMIKAGGSTCLNDTDCAANQECVASACRAVVSCEAPGSCPTGQVCRGGACRTVCPDDGCPDGFTCDAAEQVCVPDTTSSGGATGSGGANGSGGGDPGTGGTGGGNTGPTYEMIDDLEDNDNLILMMGGRQGPWHTFNSGGGTQQPSGAFLPEGGGADQTLYAVHTSGNGFTFGGVGFDLNNPEPSVPESPQSAVFDASAWDGIVFYAKGTASLRVEFPIESLVPTERGGSCSGGDAGCWNVHGKRVGAIAADWTEYRVSFAELEREQGGNDPPFNPSALQSISFKHEGADFDFWVDEIRFYKDAGNSGTGGSTGSGGSSGAGGGTSCSIPGSPNPGSGSLTWYCFGQGTGQESGEYVTACGYRAVEANANSTCMGITDTVRNVATTNGAGAGYYAAIPGESPENFTSRDRCGACIEVTNGDRSIIATVTDQCPISSNPNCARAGHIDLSRNAFDALGDFGTGFPMGVTWRFVPCPVTGNVVVRIKAGNSDQVFIENTILPIKAVAMNGNQGNRLMYGAWQLPGNAAGATLTLTDLNDRTITVTIPGGAQALQNNDTGQQFPSCN